MLPYIALLSLALWLVAASVAYYLFRWSFKKQFPTWTNGDVAFCAPVSLIAGPIALLVGLGWAGLTLAAEWPGLSKWLSRPSKW